MTNSRTTHRIGELRRAVINRGVGGQGAEGGSRVFIARVICDYKQFLQTPIVSNWARIIHVIDTHFDGDGWKAVVLFRTHSLGRLDGARGSCRSFLRRSGENVQ